jgi:pimeloyl-ACP methyl ester carboxylesterase
VTISRQRSGRASTSAAPDLSKGVIVFLSGGGVDIMNPPEVRGRMDEYISDVNSDAFVQANSGGSGLAFQLLPGQTTKHLHQGQWRAICQALNLLDATPLILLGHSNGGAAALDLARCLQSQAKSVDLLWTCDSVLTLDDNGDPYKVPPNVTLNLNSYVIPTPAWLLAPFPIGRSNHRQADNSLDGILNIGLKYNLPGAVAHRNAFYDLAGGDRDNTNAFTYPSVLLESTLAVLHGQTNYDVITAAVTSLQVLATKAHTEIHVDTTDFSEVLHP